MDGNSILNDGCEINGCEIIEEGDDQFQLPQDGFPLDPDKQEEAILGSVATTQVRVYVKGKVNIYLWWG